MGNKETRQQNVRFSSYFRYDFKFVNETHTVCGVTSFQGLAAFLSRSSEFCGRTNFFLRLKSNVLIKSSPLTPQKKHLRYSDKKANA